MPAPSFLLKMPAYLKDFRCLGAQCEDHCCYGWDVIVDRRSYERYRGLPPRGLGLRIQQALEHNRKDPSEARYAKFRRKTETCPFLTPQRLCRIHAELGEDFLPDTCVLFPRHLRARASWVELSASMACPEIARSVLANPEAVEMIDLRLDPPDRMSRGVESALPSDVEASGFLLRGFAVALLKDRRHAVWQRLLLLGFLLETVGSQPPGLSGGAMESLLDGFARRMASGELKGLMESAPVLPGLQLQLVGRLYDEVSPTVRVKAFKACVEACWGGLDPSGAGIFSQDAVHRYDAAHRDRYLPFFENHGFMLENFLLHYLWHHDFCFHQGRRVYDDYVTMVLHFAMLKTCLIGLAARQHEEMNGEMVRRVMYALTKVVEPDARFRDYALGLLAGSGCTDMMHLAVLIKN